MLWGYINKYSRLSRRGVAKTSLSTLLVSLLSCNFVERLEATKDEFPLVKRKKRKVERKLPPPRLATGDVFSASLARQSV